MKILQVSSAVHSAGGGTSEVVPRLCRALKELGHEVVLAVIKTDDICQQAQDALDAGVKIISFKKSVERDAFAFSPAMRRGLREWVSWADIVQTHGLWQAPIWYGAAECLRQKKPYLMMPHGFIEPERLKKSKWKKRIIGALFDRRYLRQANRLVATAESEAEGFRQYGLTNPIHIMPIGLDLDQFNVKDSSQIQSSPSPSALTPTTQNQSSTVHLPPPPTTQNQSSAVHLHLHPSPKRKAGKNGEFSF